MEQLKKITKILSAVLASNNHYTLDKMVLERVQQKHDQAEEEKRVPEEKRNEKHWAANEKFYKMAEKYHSGRSLYVDDMKCLILCVKSGTDSPLKSKKAEVELQYNRRKQQIDDSHFVSYVEVILVVVVLLINHLLFIEATLELEVNDCFECSSRKIMSYSAVLFSLVL